MPSHHAKRLSNKIRELFQRDLLEPRHIVSYKIRAHMLFLFNPVVQKLKDNYLLDLL